MNQSPVCAGCRGQLTPTTTSRFQEYHGEYFILENVPVLVCAQCGEIYFTPEAHDLVLKLVRGHAAPDRMESVKVYDATTA